MSDRILTAEEKQALEARLQEYVGQETGPAQQAPDAVNEAMVRHWCEAMGDANPIYVDAAAAEQAGHGGLVAPPTMLQAWILSGMAIADPDAPGDRQRELHQLLTDSGYPSVVATNCEQEYTRYLRPGDRVSAHTVVEAISEEKATALGVGYFIDTRTSFTDPKGGEVGWMTFRVLKFRPHQQPAAAATEEGGAAAAAPRRLRAPLGHDNAWWWEGIERGELLIQECGACGVLRHPPRPMCGECRSLEWKARTASGAGTVHSWVVMHHPLIPGYEFPLTVALVDLEEGTRLVANVANVANVASVAGGGGGAPTAVHIGQRVQARIENVDEELKLPVFYPVQ